MPSESGPREQIAGPRIAVAPVVEFHFGLFLITKHFVTPEKTVPAWVSALSAPERDAVTRFVGFWEERGLFALGGGDAPYREYGELLVAAWQAGMLLENDVESFLSALPAALAGDFPIPPLDSESPEIRELVARRLALLRTSAADREAYCEGLRDIWSIVRPYLESSREATERAAAEFTVRARSEDDLRALVPGNAFLHKDEYQAAISAARTNGEVVIVPLGLGGSGQLFWTFPGVVLIGVGLESGERAEKRRERSERAAGRFKVLSDPTRVAILFELLRPSHNASTVTELASLFRLSQPTVSVHIKLLREAGLIRAERNGNQVHYQAADEVVRRFVDEAVEDITGALYPASPQPAPA